MFSPKITTTCLMGVTGCPRGVPDGGVVDVEVAGLVLEQPAAAKSRAVAADEISSLRVMADHPREFSL
jgi:hypothetical protein